MMHLWYKDAIIYELDVKIFQDSNGDGIGDFQGLARRLPHIASLGVTCLWLRPFYPSPNKDDGYDVADYYGIDPRLGTLGDFVDFLTQARERGIRVLADLVVNHTSDQHPWFRAARQDKNSPYRDYYIWSEQKPQDLTTGIVFPGVQQSVWAFDEVAGAYYHHQFYKHQPDLNVANPAVCEEIRKIISFWVELGLSGFRLDAAWFLVGPQYVGAPVPEDPFAQLRRIRQTLSWQRGDAVLLAEANVPIDEIMNYFGLGPEVHMLFNFPVNQRLFLALAREDATSLVEVLQKLPNLPETGQWANFLRNHDELDLGRLSEQERAEVYAAFAPQESMRIYHRGIRRRLAPMLGGDTRRMQLAYSLLLSLPGTPVLRYGSEIGMGEDLSLPERYSVRTPMQWSDEPNAGFSSTPRERLIRPVVSRGEFGYEKVNVAAQQRDSQSFMNWMKRLIHIRRDCPEIGWGACTILDTGQPGVFAHRCDWQDGAIIAVHNLASKPTTARLNVDQGHGTHLVELFGNHSYESPTDSSSIELTPYGCRWFRVAGKTGRQP
jgi:maltose alpha-D-glucosyltransferase/alpha-amylase